jgi:hypothetical protein
MFIDKEGKAFQSRPSGIFIYYFSRNAGATLVLDISFNPVQAGFLFITDLSSVIRQYVVRDEFQSRPSGIFVYYETERSSQWLDIGRTGSKVKSFNPVQAGFLFITQIEVCEYEADLK